ncbi:curli production assembly/transport component CsgF [Algoriphagus formosus]|jgi:curli production assembly/transport component CsgF|uniref:Curli production assembly/transport component CsgF n=1 Tax=Algoriphagus formosus TaxID=2007308 RepID=A0A4R5URY7_9BACT|nr:MULTISPECIES: curli production assembly/transport component CsgF [Algoriphagus]TDK41854.1 curli production assembly/transport component CsgF [Algoriphagus aquimaris]
MKKVILFAFVFSLIGLSDLFAQRLVYTPQNPAFGGNTFNYQWLLSSAQAQDTFEDPASRDDRLGFGQDPLNDFSESLNRQILSRLSREIIDRQFGEESLESGSYNLGDYQIDISNSGSGLIVTIIDNVTGATSIIEVPFF